MFACSVCTHNIVTFNKLNVRKWFKPTYFSVAQGWIYKILVRCRKCCQCAQMHFQCELWFTFHWKMIVLRVSFSYLLWSTRQFHLTKIQMPQFIFIHWFVWIISNHEIPVPKSMYIVHIAFSSRMSQYILEQREDKNYYEKYRSSNDDVTPRHLAKLHSNWFIKNTICNNVLFSPILLRLLIFFILFIFIFSWEIR